MYSVLLKIFFAYNIVAIFMFEQIRVRFTIHKIEIYWVCVLRFVSCFIDAIMHYINSVAFEHLLYTFSSHE